MRNQMQRLRLKIACPAAIAAMLALSGSAEAVTSTSPQPPSSRPPPPKTYTCSCACKGESATNVVYSNKTFFSTVPCSSWSGKACSVTVVTKGIAHTVSGRWEGCH